MTSQIERDPYNPASAWCRAIDLVGVDALAEALGLSPNTVYDFAKEDKKPSGNIWQIMDAEDLCVLVADEAPFTAFMGRWVEAKRKTNQDIALSASQAASSASNLVTEILKAQSPNSEGGRKFSPNEKARATRAIANIKEDLDRAQRAINQD